MPTPARDSDTASTILNQVAAEAGIKPVTDPYSSQDETFVQLQYLLNTAGAELRKLHQWSYLETEATITSIDVDGSAPLPEDFDYMIDQTGWERNNTVPLFGPLSAQEWQYLQGRNLVSSTIYASFRLTQGDILIYPTSASDLDIHYEYISTYWVQDGDDVTVFKRKVEKGHDRPVFPELLLSRYLKVKYQESRGLDSTKAQDTFNQMFMSIAGQDKSAKVLNAGATRNRFPYLAPWNLPDSGYGV